MVTEVTYVIVNDVKQLLTNPSNICVDDREYYKRGWETEAVLAVN